MKIETFTERCIGAGNCVAVSAKYFDLDEEGIVVINHEDVHSGDEAEVERAVDMCPAMAIELSLGRITT